MLLSKRVVKISQCILHVVFKIGLKLLKFFAQLCCMVSKFQTGAKKSPEKYGTKTKKNTSKWNIF
jgi:hypothetical protein